jgi:LPXTG-site transpeptidase (sortase) family protein
MDSKIDSKLTLFATIAMGLILLTVFMHDNVNISLAKETSSLYVTSGDTTARQGRAVPGLPIRLMIPEINVNAVIESVGLTLDGAVGVPVKPSGAAWFDLGPRPGEVGSSVIVGHSGWWNNVPAVFDDLKKLNIGDKIYVEDENGATVIFVVREIRHLASKADAPGAFESSDGISHLNLITCEGVWNSLTQNYSGRLLVFADREMTIGYK